MPAAADFANATYDDARLTTRLVRMAERFAAHPGASLPEATGTDSALEATYRFFRNKRVTSENILASHHAATVDRAKDLDVILVAHDTTQLSFSTDREGFCHVNGAGWGFFAHVALAMQNDAFQSPLGIAGLSSHAREHPKRKDKKHSELIPYRERESFRWPELVDVVAARFGSRAVHLLDSEADAYRLLEHMIEKKQRFVVRASHNRGVTDNLGERRTLGETVASLEGVCQREIALSARAPAPQPAKKGRRNPARAARLATLSFSATRVTLHACGKDYATKKSIELNVVHVIEIHAPDGAEPVEWKLYTTEPIKHPDDILRIVDFYRARWRIEELFKALKTGCAFEKLQLESLSALLKALAIYLPIACDLLLLRAIARCDPERPARLVLPPLILLLLQLHPTTRLAENATARDACNAVARFGGHIKNNGDPGWIVLGRGYETVRQLAEGMSLGMGNTF